MVADGAAGLTVSRSALLELKSELELVNDGYEFLDEKRILLAAEMLRQRDAYRDARSRFLETAEEARQALFAAAGAHGLEGLQVYPAREAGDASLEIKTVKAVGQVMLTASLEPGEPAPGRPAVLASPEARDCEAQYRELLVEAAALAAITTNLARLVREYRRTERRVRALENVVMPEIRESVASMEEQLEIVEQEEVIRVRSLRKGASSRGLS